MKYYYDIVASICNEVCRTNSHLVCGGFDTLVDAIDYINRNNVSEVDYYKYCTNNETAYIEVEKHSDNGCIVDIIIVDQEEI